MKTGLVKTIAAFFILAMVACNNDKTEETKTATPASSAPAPVKVEPKTEISVGPDGAEVKTKDVKVKLDTKDNNQK